MEQVAANHGDGISEIRALCVENLLKSPRGVELPKSFQDFYDFPEQCGWEVMEDSTLKPCSKSTGKQQSLPFFIQAWLFFGLIFTVVQINKKPILSFDDLHNGKLLSTKLLHEAIEKWTNWEAQHREGLRFRLIQAGWVLDMARQVIQKSYAYDYAGDGDAHKVDDDDTESLTAGERNEQVDYLHVGDKSVLVLMCLGETLSAAKARIVELNKVETTGWHGDDKAGWGPPRYVFKEMEKQGWCPRAMEILRGQVSSNATMLVAAYQAYQKSSRMTNEHRESECTRQECKVKSRDERGNYQNRHTQKCKGKNCKPCGPPEEDVLAVLQKEDDTIPMLMFCDDESEGKKFRVISFDTEKDYGKDFVTISHVWSDGWGNEEENKLNRCQVDFIRRQIHRATGNWNTPFWMDTLVIPVAKGQEECRKKGIRQIFDVFASSSHTIILDNGLSAMDQGGPDKPAEAAMKIFSSVWMRRLWTLQEAYLSRNIFIPFEEDAPGTDNLMSFDGIEEQLERFMKKSTSGITQMVKIQLSRMIMGEERRSRNAAFNRRTYDTRLKEKASTVVANAYRAARWRTTGKAEHEVLALATLLNLDTKKTKIEEAGLDAPGEPGESFDLDRLEELVCVFWDELHKQHKGAIPSGMIFLPGEKINRQGFGWAPRTWLSAYEMEYPDPLNFWNRPTEFNAEKGLGVYYPGFLLHPDSPGCRSRILGTSIGSQHFTFPVDRSLHEWYSFQILDDPASGHPNEVTRQEKATTQLAIILSGSFPRESPREIALLVELTGSGTYETSDETLDRKPVEHYASIIHRILIWRDSNYLNGSDDRQNFKMGYVGARGDKHVCLGEMVGPTQRWWVDRPVNTKTENIQVQVMEGNTNDFQPTPPKRRPTFLKYFFPSWGGSDNVDDTNREE